MSEPDHASDEEELGEEEEELDIEPSFPTDIIKLNHSFGYDCKRLFNIVHIDKDTLVFVSGKYLHYFSISKREVRVRESVFHAGIGFITKNNVPQHDGLLTVGENGPKPTVFIYEYPSHKIRVKLEGAAKTCFTCGSYNATGELFASQAGYPDFMLTIWRWSTAEIILRSKAFQSDVLFVHFSRYNPILLVSSGLSHIKFWKMANTFTGLKLKGELGRFDKTDFSDIYATYMLGDENVISGCDWGNMFLWEAGLIKFEITRKGRKPCHTKPITYIRYDDGEVMTIGMDGYVRIWFWETVDVADPPDDDRFVEIEPINEFKIGDCEIRGQQKKHPYDKNNYEYYVQDGNGGFWICDLNPHETPKPSRKLYTCHGGKVIAAQVSPVSTHLMTLGEDGKIFAFDYKRKSLVLEKQFVSLGTDLLWFNTNISSSGMELAAGFQDGILRTLLFNPNKTPAELAMVRSIKAHTGPITKLSVNPANTILATGAADRTVFIYQIITGEIIQLKPMGFVQFDGIPNFLNWKMNEKATLLIGGKSGEVYECRFPLKVKDEQTFLSYNLTAIAKISKTRFVSVKSVIRRDMKRKMAKERKEKKRARKMEEIERLQAANPGLQVDLETALADSEPEEEEEPLHIPAKPNPILWLKYTNRQTIWLSMGGYDAGYIYELNFESKEPVYSTVIADGDDCEIHSYLEIDKFLIFGLITGDIRINGVNPNNFTDLRDYRLFRMHEPLKGTIPQMLISYDFNNLFTIGHDGNVFSYDWNGPRPIDKPSRPTLTIPNAPKDVRDIEDPQHPSLEQEKIFAEQKRQEEAAAAHARKVMAKIDELQVRFNALMAKNEKLHPDLIIPHQEMLLDERITEQINDELQAELDDVREDLAYDLEFAQVGKQKLYDYFLKDLEHLPLSVRGIGNNAVLHSFRLQRLGEEYEQALRDIEERLRMEAAKKGPPPLALAEEHEPSLLEPGVERFFYGRNPDSIIPKFSKKMLRLLKRYRSRQLYEVERIYNWEKLQRRKPDPNKNHPEDDRMIREAELTLGDYKLKTGADYEPSSQANFTHKYIEIAECREKYFKLLKSFNDRVFERREQKKKLYEFIAEKRKELDLLHELIPEPNRVYLPDIPEIDMNEEYPELNLIEHCTPTCGIEIDDILYLERHVVDMLPKPPPPPIPEPPSKEEVHKREKHFALRVGEIKKLPHSNELMASLEALPATTEPAYVESVDGAAPPILTEVRYRWLLELMNEQEGIVFSVRNRIEQFNNALEEENYLRYQVKFEADFLQSFMVALNQELYILRDSEEIENQLQKNAEIAMITRNEAQLTINMAMRQIEECRKASEKLNDQVASVQLKFMSTVKGHKFFDFLRRIFKKKYRPPKPPKEGDESSESSSDDESSSEDEEADAKSVDSTDVTAIRLDETHCPPGLERPMYELAFKLRAERHGYEQQLLDQAKLTDQKRREVLDLQKQMKFHEDVYNQENEKLLSFRRLRQQKLNKVKLSIVLRMSQVQHFYAGEDFRDLSKAILFDAGYLVKLKSRVDQLNNETQETRRLHRVNIVHLRRMNVDLKFMRAEINRLEADIREAMVRKFGIVVNLNDLEGEVLRKYIFDLETNAEDELREIDRMIRIKNNELAALQRELIRELQINTEKVHVLSVLQEEKNYLDNMLDAQERNFEKSRTRTIGLDHDIDKLVAIDRQQQEQIQCLEREILTLRFKSRPLELDGDKKSTKGDGTREILPPEDGDVQQLPIECPEMLEAHAYDLRLVPDDFIMERVLTIVQKCFFRNFGVHTTKDNVRKYAKKAARYLGQAAYTLQGKITENIMDCITEGLQDVIPKRYMIYLSANELSRVFNEIATVFDYERSEVNTEDLILGIFNNVMDVLEDTRNILNKTQFIFEGMFKQLIEVLPLEEFQGEETKRVMLDIFIKESLIDPKLLSMENLISTSIEYARENLLDNITTIPIRRLAEYLRKGLENKRSNISRTSLGSVASVSISKKK